LIRLPIAVASVAFSVALWSVLYPMPPLHLRIATASPDGAYYLNAQRYAELFSVHGVSVDIQTSAGSQQNLEMLRNADRRTDLAFVQGGFGYLGASSETRDRSEVETLANVDVEPLWLFSRHHDIDSLNQLQGLRVAIGPQGSGSRNVALKLLDQARIPQADVKLSSLTANSAVNALRQGTVDVVLIVASADSHVVQNMLSVPGIKLASLSKSAAITERNPYLESRLLPQGSLDTNIPPRDIVLLSTSASLLARDDLHPALKKLSIAVATQVHAGSGVFHRAGDFPSLRRIDFPTSPQSRYAMLHGPSALERALPFWWAQVAERILLIVLPCALLAVLLMRLIPAYLRGILEGRINRWYGELKFIENDLRLASPSGLDFTRFVSRLNSIEQDVTKFAAPKDLMTRSFTLHHHIEFVRLRLHGLRGR
jgi:uncharacterized protein